MTQPPRQGRSLAVFVLITNALLAVCGLLLLLTNLDGEDTFLAVCGGLMLAAGTVSFFVNWRNWRRS
jgi:predicted membrane channel-forming protein YqfA (hemolysin III family)